MQISDEYMPVHDTMKRWPSICLRGANVNLNCHFLKMTEEEMPHSYFSLFKLFVATFVAQHLETEEFRSLPHF